MFQSNDVHSSFNTTLDKTNQMEMVRLEVLLFLKHIPCPIIYHRHVDINKSNQPSHPNQNNISSFEKKIAYYHRTTRSNRYVLVKVAENLSCKNFYYQQYALEHSWKYISSAQGSRTMFIYINYGLMYVTKNTKDLLRALLRAAVS